MLKAFAVSAKDSIHKIEQINNILNEARDMVFKENLKIPDKILHVVFERAYCKIEILTSTVGIHRDTASKYLKILENTGILKSQKSGREVIYLNTNLIDIFKGE